MGTRPGPAGRDRREEGAADGRRHVRPKRRPAWHWATLLVAIGLGVILLLRWQAMQPAVVEVVEPQPRTVTETVAASGQVGGKRETAVGAQAQGVIAELWVDEGDVVRRGQPLARIRNDVARAQVSQAQQALRTARAQLAEASAGARPTELQAAQAQVRQAEATVRQQAAAVEQARAGVTQAEARLELARKTLERNRYLLGEGAIARQSVDQAEADYRVAQAALAAARDSVATARANLAAARAAVAASRAQLGTLEAGPRTEAVHLARQRVREAEAALRVAQAQAQSFTVYAPFAGTVTQIIAEPGTAVGLSGGVVRLVQTTRPEIRVDVDESNLAELRVGQHAVVTSPTFRNARLEARVTQIGAQVDPARGTVEVTVVPEREPEWLRPGQTVDVNIVTSPSATRLVIPRSAVRREGGAQNLSGRSIVYVIQDGRAQPRPVVLGPVEGDLVPVLEGLSRADRVIRSTEGVEAGARVRVRRGS